MNTIKNFTITALFLIISISGFAQSRKITFTAQNLPIKEALAQIQQKSGYRILYNDEIVADDVRISVNAKNLSVSELLQNMLKETDLGFKYNSSDLIIITKKSFLETNSEIFGNVTDERGGPLPFANVVLFEPNGEGKIYKATVTDLKGNFEFLQLAHGAYRLQISFVGYKNITENISLNETKQLAFQLTPDEKLLEQVTVEADEVRTSINKNTYQIKTEDIVGAVTALDLVEKVPQLQVDRVSEKIVSSDGKTIKILLNGVNATEIDLKSLRPENIQSIEYYDIPPARYAEFGSVLNVITKEREDGFAGGININHAFTTGFGNDNAYFKYNKGKHQLSLDYALNHRNYRDRQYGSTYEYSFKSVDYVRENKGKDKFGYDDHTINLTYSNQMDENYAFQARVSPNMLTYHADGNNNINYSADDLKTTRTGTSTTRQKVFSPVVDLYYWKQLKNKQELAFNVVGTAFNTSNIYTNKEYDSDGILELNDDMNEQNRKYSIISEVNYMKTLGFGTVNFGYNVEANTMFTDIENSFDDTNYQTSFLQNYAYGELTARKNKWMWMASLGLSNRQQNSYQNSRNDWIFRPRATIGYSFSSSHSLRLLFDRRNSEPSLSSLSNNKVYVTNQIIRQGNPMLRHSISNRLQLTYNLSFKYANIIITPSFNYVQRPVSSYFTEKDDFIVMMSENGIKSYEYGTQINLDIKPFGNNMLVLRGVSRIINREQYTSQIGYFSHLYTPFWYTASFSHKGFRAIYQGNIPSKSLSGPYISTDENNGHFFLSYSKDNWSVSSGILFIGQPSKYFTNTIPKSIVQYNSYTRIYDNKNMFIVSFSYNFNKGKKYDEKQKNLQNSDTDNGMF